MDRKLFEFLSDYIYNNPTKVFIGSKENTIKVIFYDKPEKTNTEVLIDHAGYHFTVKIEPDRTHIKFQPVVLSQKGWVTDGDAYEEHLWDDDHKLFKPLYNRILEEQEKERNEKLEKLTKMLLSDKVWDRDPLDVMVEAYKEQVAREHGLGPKGKRTGAFGGGDVELIDFTKAHEDFDDGSESDN